MTSYVVLTYKDRISTRTTEYHSTLSALKRKYTRAMNQGTYDKVTIVDSNEINYFEHTRYAGDQKWTGKVVAKSPAEWDPA